ncbi:UxaA family hydrolase [Pectinatus cerevisiiphilus]|uniref:(2R)-sulfolactate sulfo-lyase subunit alpha n=1 Tax=Pectinatus cerevisiiphilus TaxID=86956 RepID=A0A4R3KAH0_9FIRM|nr:UxaA family hydrolase [Pectinatus cerevisiiphilus]TCS80096.1 (2R)-sulfolactate sulfo-lyase subunit alpha [Pectinatus cerevisiiphilus]
MADHKFLIHEKNDSVGVAIININEGDIAKGIFLTDNGSIEITAAASIPLGHKIALHPIKAGEFVIEYGEKIGRAFKDIAKGDLVHTHNLKSIHWIKK